LRGIVTHHSRRAAQTAEAVAASLDLSRPRVEDMNDVSEGAYRYAPRGRWCSVKDAFYGPHFALAVYLDLASSTGYSSCMSIADHAARQLVAAPATSAARTTVRPRLRRLPVFERRSPISRKSRCEVTKNGHWTSFCPGTVGGSYGEFGVP